VGVRLARSVLLVVTICLAGGGPSFAEVPDASEAWTVTRGGPLLLDAGLFTSPATSLGPSLSTGAAVGIARGKTFAWQARASWSSATESSIAWTDTQWDLRLRAGGLVQHALGRAHVGIRLGLGPNIVHEDRTRNQGQRAGLSGSAQETTAFTTIPAGDLEGVVAVHVFSRWLLVMSGGPDASLSSGTVRVGWLAQLGVGWEP
jgi:hypothetical protein